MYTSFISFFVRAYYGIYIFFSFVLFLSLENNKGFYHSFFSLYEGFSYITCAFSSSSFSIWYQEHRNNEILAVIDKNQPMENPNTKLLTTCNNLTGTTNLNYVTATVIFPVGAATVDQYQHLLPLPSVQSQPIGFPFSPIDLWPPRGTTAFQPPIVLPTSLFAATASHTSIPADWHTSSIRLLVLISRLKVVSSACHKGKSSWNGQSGISP